MSRHNQHSSRGSRFFRVGRLTALQKPNGGVRGIVCWDVSRRLVARTMAQQLGPAIERATSPSQHALSTRAGTECIAQAMSFDRLGSCRNCVVDRRHRGWCPVRPCWKVSKLLLEGLQPPFVTGCIHVSVGGPRWCRPHSPLCRPRTTPCSAVQSQLRDRRALVRVSR